MSDSATTLPPLIDPEALRAYLADALPAGTRPSGGLPTGTLSASSPLDVQRIRGGHSNETFLVRRADDQWVLRRPPRGPLLPTAHDVTREYRVLQALVSTNVPVPTPIHLCTDASVIGAPFYLMSRVDGIVLRSALPEAFQSDPQARADIGAELVDRLADLHAVDWQAAGLSDFGKPQGYLERQLRRWTGQLDASRTRALPDLDTVTLWLHDNLPVSGPATIVHGDYRLDNAMYAATPPARIVAILDWEMATLGDPLADLGYLLSFWRELGDASSYLDESWRVTTTPGFLTRTQLVARYAQLSGRAIQAIQFYVALAIWKLAILLEGSYVRHKAGTTDDPFFTTLERGVPALAQRALVVCRGDNPAV